MLMKPIKQPNSKQPNKFQAFANKLGPLVYNGLIKRGYTKRSTYDNVMSQLAFESTYGTSPLALRAHNYGGYGYNGKDYNVYKDDAAFIDAYLNDMAGKYKKALNADTVADYAKELKRIGYFEAPLDQYTKNLIGMQSVRKAAAVHYGQPIVQQKPALAAVQLPKNFVPQETAQTIEESAQNAFKQPVLPPVGRGPEPEVEVPQEQSSPFIFQHSIDLPPIEQTMGALLNDQPLVNTPGFKNGKDSEYYSYMDKLAQRMSKEWNMSEDEALTQMLNDNTYNYKAFYDNNKKMAIKSLSDPSGTHFNDVGKTMYHPTFSNESIYSGKVSDYNPLGLIGGQWVGYNKYIPSADQLNRYFNYNRTRSYMNNNGDRGVKIVMPKHKKVNLPGYKGGKDDESLRYFARGAQNAGLVGQDQSGNNYNVDWDTVQRRGNKIYAVVSNGKNKGLSDITQATTNIGQYESPFILDDVLVTAPKLQKSTSKQKEIDTSNIQPRMLQNTSSPTYAKDQAKAKTGDIDKVVLGTLGLGLAPIAAQAAPAALAPGGAFWSNPMTQGIAASSLGAQAVNTASNAIMHKDWSTAMSDAIQNSTGYRPSEYITEFTNPGTWLGMGGAKLDISGNPIQQIKDIYQLGKAASDYPVRYIQNKINLNKIGNKLIQRIDNTNLPNEIINDASKQYSTESKDVLYDTILNMPNYSGTDGKFNTNYTQAPKLSRPITDRQVQAFNGDFDLIDKDGNINMRAAVRLNRKLKDNGIFYKRKFNKDTIIDDFKKAYEMSKQFPIPDDSTRKQFVEASVIGSLFGVNKHNNINIDLPKDDFKYIFNNEFDNNVIEAAFQENGLGIINKSPLERAVYLTRNADSDYNSTIFKYPFLHYPSKDGIKPLNVSDDIPLRQQLRDYINPYLRTNGMDPIPLDSDYNTASKILDDRINQRSRFLRGVMDYKGNVRVKDEYYHLLDDNVNSEYGDNSVKSRLEYAATHIPTVATNGGRVGLYEEFSNPKNGASDKVNDGLYISSSKNIADNFSAPRRFDPDDSAIFTLQIPTSHRDEPNLIKRLALSDFDVYNNNSQYGGGSIGVKNMYYDPFRLQTGKSLDSVLKQKAKEIGIPLVQRNEEIFDFDLNPELGYFTKGHYNQVKPLIDADNILKDKGINFRILSDKFYNDKGLSVQNYKSRKALAEDIDYVNKLVDDLHYVDPFTKKTVRLESYDDSRFIGILNQFITSKDNSIRKFGFMIRDAILKKDFDKYEQLISSKKMFDSIINEKLKTLKTTYKVSDQIKRFKKDPAVLKQIMDEYGAIPRYQMDGFGEHDLFLNNGKTSAKSKIASEGYLLGKRGEKVVDVEDVQYIHKGISRREIQQRNNGNIDRQDQTENLSMKNLRNVILPVLGLGALKKKNKK